MFTFYGFPQSNTVQSSVSTRISKYCKAFKLTLLFPKQYGEPKKLQIALAKTHFQ